MPTGVVVVIVIDCDCELYILNYANTYLVSMCTGTAQGKSASKSLAKASKRLSSLRGSKIRRPRKNMIIKDVDVGVDVR